MNLSNFKTLKHYLKGRISHLNRLDSTPKNKIKISAAVELLAHLNSIKK